MADCELPVAVYALFLEDRPEMRTSPNCDPEQTRNQTESEHPVRKVCWLDAIEFCNWLSQRQGLAPCYESAAQDLWRCNFAADGFRLPTEAEWEYACRARSTTRFCFGDAEESASSYAWTIKNSRQEVQPVRQRLPNAWGLFDMHGNVAEWCWDKYWSYPDQSEIDRRVQAGLHPYQGVVPENTGPFRVARGGMSNDYEYDVTSSSRTRHEPTACESRIGFRVVQAWPRQPE
jgi:formylglycine-generating enzyme required for sulfatase activity